MSHPMLPLLERTPVIPAVKEPETLDRALCHDGAAVFLLGFSGQLFIENNTLYAVWAGLVLLVWLIAMLSAALRRAGQ